MATPGMGWQQPQHGYGGGSAPGAGKLGSGSAQAGLGAEHSPDLHFKMSKKIAQLTKRLESSYEVFWKRREGSLSNKASKSQHNIMKSDIYVSWLIQIRQQ
ncbi:hypothetical protein BTVI_118532 [Pitangus sulphuratus]|nr:hypothetical protein BTVI_118532 [Pitangus sulphuratus]